jgi:sulfite exporter TauE/SafE/copper chaperone CopZ
MNTNEKQKYNFHVHGMHCNSCELLIEGELKDLPHIHDIKSSFKNNILEVTGNFGDKTAEQIAVDLTMIVKVHGYTISTEKQKHRAKWEDFKIAIPIALAFAILFILLQKAGMVNLINSNKFNYSTAFIIGIVASLSSCMAVVGGVLLSMSAMFAKEDSEEFEKINDNSKPIHFGLGKVKPQLLFHAGRIGAFFILGGVIGAIGSAFTLSPTTTLILGLIIGIVMLILGVNLLDIFPWAKRLQPSMPKFIAKRANSVSEFGHTFMPLFVGISTFFLPCGFTQSMQLYTLTTGTFWKGGLTMLAFALGTLPILALISFSSFSIKNNSKSGIFFKSAGLIVIMFAFFNIINSLVAAGFISPIFNF